MFDCQVWKCRQISPKSAFADFREIRLHSAAVGASSTSPQCGRKQRLKPTVSHLTEGWAKIPDREAFFGQIGLRWRSALHDGPPKSTGRDAQTLPLLLSLFRPCDSSASSLPGFCRGTGRSRSIRAEAPLCPGARTEIGASGAELKKRFMDASGVLRQHIPSRIGWAARLSSYEGEGAGNTCICMRRQYNTDELGWTLDRSGRNSRNQVDRPLAAVRSA